jgi:hypothetical protein
MNSFLTARPEYSPLVRLLWHDVAQSHAASSNAVQHTVAVQHTITSLLSMGCHAALLDAPSNDVAALIQNPFHLWLTRNAAVKAPRRFIWYGTEDFNAAEAAAWTWPADEPELVSIVAVPLLGTQGSPDWSRAIALTPDAASEWPPADAFGDSDVRFYFWTQSSETSTSPDLLNAAVFQSLTASTQQSSEQTKTEFHDSVQGIYLDMTSRDSAAATVSGFPWSPGLPQVFFEHHGYSIAQRLGALVANTGSDAARVRQDYWATVTRLCAGNLRRALDAAPNATTTDAATTSLGGATANETLSALVGRCGDIVSLWREVSVPSINFGAAATEKDLTARLCASVAALQGQERCLAQTWPALNWDSTPAARLPILHHLMHFGINAFVPAAARDSLSAPGTNVPGETHQPFAAQWKPFADYVARCSEALAQGRNGARIGLLWSVRSAWAHYNPNGHRFVRWVEEDLQDTAQLLDELHFDFVLLPEDDLCAASIEAESQTSTRLLCGKAQLPLEMIVLSSVTTLSRAAWDKLQEFIESGGKVAFFGLLPRWSERGRDTEFEEKIGQATRLSAGDLYDAYAAREDNKRTVVNSADEYTTYPIAREYHSGGRLCCYQPRLEADTDSARLYVRRILSESLVPEFETQAPDVLYTRRLYEDGELYFVWNKAAIAQRINLRLRPVHDGVPHLLDAWTGTNTPVAEWTRFTVEEGGGLSLTLAFAPQEAHLVLVEYRSSSTQTPRIERTNMAVETFEDTIARGYMTENGTPAIAARDQTGKLSWHYGDELHVPPPLLLDDWNARRLDPNVLVLQTQHEIPGWRAAFEIAQPPESLYLCLSRQNALSQATLNGQPLRECDTPFSENTLWRDAVWQWFDLAGARDGRNELLVQGRGPVSELRLVGDFDLEESLPDFWGGNSTANDMIVTPPRPLVSSSGSWHEQGLPFYSGAVEYSQCVVVPPEWSNCRIFLEISQSRDVCEAQVNGISCGVRLAQPYRFDVTPAVRSDTQNEVLLRVWNSAQAALQSGQEKAPSGLLGPVRLVAYPAVEIGGGQ